MTIAFLIIAAAMLAVCVFFLCRSLLRQRHDRDREPGLLQDNVAAAQAQLIHLRQARAEHLMGAEELRDYQEEIQAQLLADTADTRPPPQFSGGGKAPAWAAVLFLLAAAPALYMVLGAPQQLSRPALPSDPAAAVAELERRLRQAPEDVELLILAGQTMMLLQRYAEAADYYGRARAADGDTPALLAAQLEALVWINDPRTDAVLAAALLKAPDEPIVLWVAGLRARQRGELLAAKEYWRQLHAMLEGSDMQADIAAALAELDSEQTPIGGGEGFAAAGGESVAVTVAVALADDLQNLVTDNMALFIFARGDGNPIPLAVTRVLSGQLPLTVVLDDSAAMSSAATMSDAEQYQIVARISKSGDARASAGDLYGAVNVGRGQRADVLIDQVVGAPAARQNAASAAAVVAAAVTVQVELAAAWQSRISDDTALFIFARGGGKPMPLAVKRLAAGQLPLTVVLDDSAAMSPAAKMSDTDRYRIVARLSSSGSAQAQPGDLYGEINATRGESVKIVIDKTVQPQ